VDAVVVEEYAPCALIWARSCTPSALTTPACTGMPPSDTPICSKPQHVRKALCQMLVEGDAFLHVVVWF
jgi:hypothetical protein